MIEEIFKAGGVLSELKPGYKERPIQIEAAKILESMLNSDEKAYIMEGECGTGKSFAYLIPILEKIASNGFKEKVVIVTSNISLQEQLAFRDVPFAIDVIKRIHPETPKSFNGVLFKGRQNFLCNAKMKGLIADSYVDGYDIGNDTKTKDLINWYYDTSEGDLTELSFVPEHQLLSNIACLEADECVGVKKCDCGQECFYAKHKQRIYNANIIITNYHMLFTDLSMDGASLLPEYDYIVFDECHELGNIYRDFKTKSLSLGTIRWIGKKVTEIIKRGKEEIGYYSTQLDTAKLLFESESFLDKIRRAYSQSSYDQVLLLDNIDMSIAPSNIDIVKEIDRLSNVLESVMDNLTGHMESCDDDEDKLRLSKVLNASAMVIEKLDDLNSVIMNFTKGFIPSDDIIEWIEIKEESVTINRKPLSVAQDMVDNFYTKENLKTVFASATISVGGSMDYFKSQLGLDLIDQKSVAAFIGGSPFNMKEQQLWYLPSEAIEGNKTYDFNSKLPGLVSKTIKACKGGALVLFTSYKNMKDTYENVRYDLPRGINCLKQGDAPRMKLVEKFAEDENSVLFATRSFFTGVDVPGKSLRCLIIDKLPFPQPTDPVQQKLSTRSDCFYKHSIPEMIITLKQAVGRGIRSVDDKCVICILDNRMATARYKAKISNSFNYDKTATRDLDVVGKFIDNYIGNNDDEDDINFF